MNKSVFGLNENMAAALAYLGIFISGIVILITERENKFVRFAALQSTVLFLPLFLVMMVLGWFTWIPILGPLVFGLVSGIIGFVTFLAWIYLMFMAYKGQAVKVPFIGDICWEQVHK
ncbi:MAG: hypothetical protein FWE34_04065 [Defluviitaleaceae bacterium]|nr:hypothetical protein [Defluviitaleaceae bacterium]